MTLYRPAQAIINLAALKHNLQQVRKLAPNSKVMAVIKANGYGHGIQRAANALSACDAYGVASIDEAITLRQAGFLHRIVLLEGLFSEAEVVQAINHRLDIAVHAFHQLDWLNTLDASQHISIWLKFDTGMHRLGFYPEDSDAIAERLSNLKCSKQIHLMSHFSSADTDEAFTLKQFNRLLEIDKRFQAPKSIANSAGIQRFPQMHMDWVRPGIMLYGASAGLDGSDETLNLKPAMVLKSKVMNLKWVDAGETVGYGNTWQAEQKTLLAVVAVGYGDGYPRHAPAGTPVWICDHKVPLAGRVSMDMITVDVTEIADQIRMGDEAILWGEGVTVDEVAEKCGTIGYELLCQVTPRVPRIEIEV
jgi:alanine racemase